MTEAASDSLDNKPTGKSRTGRGGARPGAGRKKGKLEPQTIERHKVLEAFRIRVAKNADRLFDAQMSIAMGVSYLYRIKKDEKGNSKKPELITDPMVISAYLDGDYEDCQDEYYYISTERPNNQAIDSMLDRTFGKPDSKVDVTSGGKTILQPAIISTIAARHAEPQTDPTAGN